MSSKPSSWLALSARRVRAALAWSLRSVPADAADRRRRRRRAGRPTGLNSQSQADADRKSAGCLTCHKPDSRVDAQGWRAGRLHRLPWRRCHGVARVNDGQGHTAIRRGPAARARGAVARHLADLGQSRRMRGTRRSTSARHSFVSSIPAISALRIRRAAPAMPKKSAMFEELMRHGGMLWGAALYNNGSYPLKDTQFGEIYTVDGQPAIVNTVPPPTPLMTAAAGHCAVSAAAFPVPSDATWQHPARLRTWRPASVGGRRSRSGRTARTSEQPVEPSRTRHAQPHRSRCSSASRKRGCWIRRSTSSARTMWPAIIARAAARRATWSTRTIDRRCTPGRTPRPVIAATASPPTR